MISVASPINSFKMTLGQKTPFYFTKGNYNYY